MARASSLLEETLRRREEAAAERGAPLSPFDEDRWRRYLSSTPRTVFTTPGAVSRTK